MKIHDNYIICPRRGGKIEAIGFGGFFLCPDYNLMCSGTVLCNDLFDCVEQKSEAKNESYYYDYDIKTSQNIERAYEEDADDEYNYELSNDGKCVKYCKQCTIYQKCIKCKNNYGLVGNKKNISELECLPDYHLNIGYYKEENSIYYSCSNNCEKCYNDKTCFQCEENYALVGNITNNETICLPQSDLYNGYYINNSIYYKCPQNCLECLNDTYCSLCKYNYYIYWNKKNNIVNCLLEEELQIGYYEENGTYYDCIDYCDSCHNDKSCNQCQDNYSLVGNKINSYLKCLYKDNLNYGYYIKNYIYYECINNCIICLNDKSCEKCENGYELVGNKENDELICLSENELNFGYYKDNNLIYYKCIDYCQNCTNDKTCKQCEEDYALVGNRDNNSLICLFENELNIGYYKVNDSIYYKCSDFCDKCSNSIKCEQCENGYELVGNKENDEIICLPEEELNIGYYKDIDSIYYKCINNCDICSNSISCEECESGYELVGNQENDILICLSDNELNIGYYKDDYNSIYYECLKYCEICSNDTYCDKCRDLFDYNYDYNTCDGRIENCEEYYLNGSCQKCEDSYSFFEDDRENCINRTSFINISYYTKDEGISFYLCDGEGEFHIKNCNECSFNKNLECNECKIKYVILDEEKKNVMAEKN